MNILSVAFISSFLFGLGLGISEMTNPKKVLSFLDVFGEWDPSLLFVMAGAILVHSFTYRLIVKRKSPISDTHFRIPTLRKSDRSLVIGSFIFGVGWGIAGICPGPAIVNLSSLRAELFAFAGSMILGIVFHRWGKVMTTSNSHRIKIND